METVVDSVVAVQLERSPEVGVPSSGVTSVGEVANTAEPLPVSSVMAAFKLADVGVARKVATPVAKPETPVEIGRPVQEVRVPLDGVPNTGVTKVGDVDNTLLPDPVEVVTPVPPDPTGRADDKVRPAEAKVAVAAVPPLPAEIITFLAAVLVPIQRLLSDA